MPIQFPRPTGPVRNYIEAQWWRLQTKAFDVVPAPNLGNPGFPTGISAPLGKRGWSLNPGIGSSPIRAVNLRRFSTMYQHGDQCGKTNPAAELFAVYDRTKNNAQIEADINGRIVGVSRDATGAALGGCAIKIFRTADDVLVASTTSDGSGNWTAYPNQPGPYYFVEYKAGSPDVFGTSPNTNTSTPFTPGA